MLKAVLFDMDGLMLDTEKIYQKFWRKAAEYYGYDMTSEMALGLRSYSSGYAVNYLKRLFGNEFDYQKVRAKRIELMNEYISVNGIEKKKGLDELLEFIRSTPLKAAVCTATHYERTAKNLESLGIMDKFDEFVCGNMVDRGKPAPDIYEYACKAINLKPCECMAVEDSPNGVISASVAGLKTVMIPDLTQPSNDISPLLFAKCDSLFDVIDLLKREIS